MRKFCTYDKNPISVHENNELNIMKFVSFYLFPHNFHIHVHTKINIFSNDNIIFITFLYKYVHHMIKKKNYCLCFCFFCGPKE